MKWLDRELLNKKYNCYIMNKLNMYFLRLLSFSFIVLLIASCSSTKDGVIEKLSENDYKPLENSLLWKIEGNGALENSYLYGTIHMINENDFFLPKGTMSAIDQTDQMVFEIDMNEMNDMGSMMGLMSKAFMNDGKTISDLLSAEDYKLLEDKFAKLGLPMMMLERIKPAFLTVFAYDIDPNGMQNGSIKSYEMEFFEMAKNASKPVSGLETLEFQMSVFDSISYEDQAKMLVDALKAGDAENDDFKVMTEMYTTQNINAMVEMIDDDEMMGGEGNNDILLTGRNKNWIPVMSDLMKTQKVFFAVGAAHLAGKTGVIHLLRKEGYTLTPISHTK